MSSPIDWPVTHKRAWVICFFTIGAIHLATFIVGLTLGQRWWIVGGSAVLAYASAVFAKQLPLPTEPKPPPARRIGCTVSGPAVVPGAKIRCLDCDDVMAFEPGLSRCRCGGVYISVLPENTQVSIMFGATGFVRVLSDD
jgi:hypothetical protein